MVGNIDKGANIIVIKCLFNIIFSNKYNIIQTFKKNFSNFFLKFEIEINKLNII